MLNITIRRKARQFGQLVRTSALTPRTGRSHKPLLSSERELGITFIGHSGFFIQIGGANLVIDPNFARWLIVLKRQRRPGVRLRDLPPIDYVLVSHAHFDHLHRPSLRAIARLTRWRCGRAPQIIVPKNVRDIVSRLGFSAIHELEWWQEFREGKLSITQTPAQHWGARMLRDFYRGFGGYVVRSGNHSLYHAGDTAYFDGFREIGRRLHPELGMLPIGAYHPPHYRNVHTSPEDALQAFLDLKAKKMIPMHYGTFRLSYEPMEEPLQRLRAAAAAAGVSDRVLVLEEGKTRIFR
ncbi:MAG TPA: MBL fold metallo-hydrolase [Terriglobales bacterium]|nr:MBL fold metallo-hydrolase [Terriglobales bacterium]